MIYSFAYEGSRFKLSQPNGPVNTFIRSNGEKYLAKSGETVRNEVHVISANGPIRSGFRLLDYLSHTFSTSIRLDGSSITTVLLISDFI